ncbi:Phosphohydrolases family gene [Elusimicrobium minutum Pei191]|uniref:Phosphohydrolases family protein n=1 Tax=Elusimicrobium minutum (strain Pei191) TaxID=445932 RepID=B2KAV4_ELUMP|nr:metallophosphoesterase [Elusimicrobium minutum]ACC97650.1 Phosphohydrolases family gene [Elusimicrobium minutum Pei191]
MWAFYALAFSVFIILHVFCSGTFYYFFPSAVTKTAFWAAPVFCTGLIVLSFALNRRSTGFFEGIVTMLGHYWTGIIFIIFSVAILMVFSEIIFNFFKIPAKLWIGRAGLCAMAVFIILGIIGGLMPPKTVTINLKSDKLPVEKLKVVQISDTHLGTGVAVKRVKKMVDQVNALEPDLIVVTGDYFENGEKFRAKNAHALKQMKAKYGVYGVFGNHEFYGGVKKSVEFFKMAGTELLRNDSVEPLPGVVVSGVDDFASAHISRSDFAEFLKTINPQKYNILLQHEPRFYDTAENKVDLMLSGHTHRGQIFPFHFLVKARYPYFYGLYTRGETKYYVTSGAFYWGPPMRLFSRNEIVLFNIEK